MEQPNNDEVICPQCCHQFRAIPVNVQTEISAMVGLLAAIDKMYSRAWDCTDGSLIVVPDSVKQFDETFDKIAALLERLNK
jgi:hypothetical protein